MVIGFILMLFLAFFITLLMGSFVPFISSWISLAYLLPLDILGPFSNSAFPWAFASSFELPWTNYSIFHPWNSWAFPSILYFLYLHYFGLVVTHSHFSISYTTHGFATSLSELFYACLLPQDLFVYFMSLWSIISATWV